MAKKYKQEEPRAPKSEAPEHREQPRTKTLEFKFEFNPDPYHEECFGIHSLVKQLNEWKQSLLEMDYHGWEADSIEHVFTVTFKEAEVSPETWDKVYQEMGISHRRSKHPYQKEHISCLHEAVQYVRNRDEDE